METTSETLRQVFSAYGELDEAIVITDKNAGISKGYGVVTFKHFDAAILALKEPNKKIDGCNTVTQRDRRQEEIGRNPQEAGNQANVVNQMAQRLNQPVRPCLRDLQRPVIGGSSIRLSEAARNNELKKAHLKALPSFHGLNIEDPLTFIRNFYSTIQTFPLKGLQEDELRMKFFVYCMKDGAKDWLINLPEGSLRRWKEICDKFMTENYPIEKTAELRKKICTFSQMEEEPFHEAWGLFKRFLNQCPHHQFPLFLLVEFFYEGLDITSRTLVDTVAGGYVYNKTENKAYEIYENLAANSRQKTFRGRRAGVHGISAQTEVAKRVPIFW